MALNANGEPFFPSQKWDHGGPIIARERIKLEPCYTTHGEFVGWSAKSLRWVLSMEDEFPLVAAMRAYVASKFGEEAELPLQADDGGG